MILKNSNEAKYQVSLTIWLRSSLILLWPKSFFGYYTITIEQIFRVA